MKPSNHTVELQLREWHDRLIQKFGRGEVGFCTTYNPKLAVTVTVARIEEEPDKCIGAFASTWNAGVITVEHVVTHDTPQDHRSMHPLLAKAFVVASTEEAPRLAGFAVIAHKHMKARDVTQVHGNN